MTITDNNTETWVSKVQALIAKAESTEFPDEAEAFMAKAQELMTRHAIDLAMLGTNHVDRGVPTSELVVVHAPYASAKVTLLASIALVNDVQCVRVGSAGGKIQISLIGYTEDIAATNTLFGSLSIQAATAMARAVVPYWEKPRRFRHAFLLGFSGKIRVRLQDARASVIEEAEAGDSGVSIVLASKKDAVDRHLRELYPRTTNRRTTASSGAGHSAGREAAERASIGQRGVSGGARALGA